MSQRPPPSQQLPSSPIRSLLLPTTTSTTDNDATTSPAVDYFSLGRTRGGNETPSTGSTTPADPLARRLRPVGTLSPRDSTSTVISPATSNNTAEAATSSSNSEGRLDEGSRKSSFASVTFLEPRNPSLPKGRQRKTDARRLRASSPSPVRFKKHIAFDNVPAGEATKNNPLSFTLNVRHQGYKPDRRSRTFMAGVDDHAYSDYALAWLLENLVDDGDEIVCVRVVEHSSKASDKNYQEDARKIMQAIQEKNVQNRAISLVLEYSVGKLHSTFQQLMQIHQPSMLIVGTRGRSLGGIQGLVGSRNSFSKYCLQYSPVPVVVVRPDDQRRKKKEKRIHNPSRQSYAALLAATHGKHEADSEASSLYELESRLSPDEEAHKVAAAIGLPAAFDPTIKPYTGGPQVGRSSSTSIAEFTDPTAPEAAANPSPKIHTPSPPLATASTESGDEDSGDEDEDEFEVMSGEQAIDVVAQKERLHLMEVDEAAALLKSSAVEDEEDEEDEEEEQKERG